jgi:Bacterial Ig domain/Secretion system C-terminal sorting domain
VWKYISACGSFNVKPTVSFIAPVQTYFLAGNHTAVVATAVDTDGSIKRVDFYKNDQLISSSTVAPYSIDQQNLTAGIHRIKAIAIDNLGASSDEAFLLLTVDALPVFTSPLSNADYRVGGSLDLQVNVNGAESRISNIEYFFNGLSNKIGEVQTSPYLFTQRPVPSSTSSQGDFLPIVAKITYVHGGMVIIDTYIHIVNSVQLNLCENLTAYIQNNGYHAGSTVKNKDKIYECRPWPYSGWCNSAAVAYAPGTGVAWQDAWIDKGSCEGNAKRLKKDNTLAASIRIFPNPATESIQLDFESSGYRVADVTVYDAFGNTLFSQKDVTLSQEINLSQLAAGVYNLHVIVGDEVTYQKVIKY